MEQINRKKDKRAKLIYTSSLYDATYFTDTLLKDHIVNAGIKSLKADDDNKISSGRPGSIVTFLSKTTVDYIIEVT